MQKETMTVHAALCEMKTMEKRISKVIEELKPIATKENAAKKVKGIEIKQFEANAKEGEQQALDMMARFNALKRAVNQYNASAPIEIEGRNYTIAEALWLMKYGMTYKKLLLTKYESEYNAANTYLEKKNGNELNAAAERSADVALGGKDKTNAEEYLDMVENYKKRHQQEFVDPLNLKQRITELRAEIAGFESAVDAKIQTSNAITEITIEY